jgi:glycosyltransferase involved in cell wall biosynthesis
MKQTKYTFLILMPYYNRPKDLVLALKSLQNQTHKNWKFAFVDDGSDEPGDLIVKSFFNEEDLNKVSFYNTGDTKEIKKQRVLNNPNTRGLKDKNAGPLFVSYFNNAMSSIEFDIALFLSDDDYLDTDYLKKLNHFYTRRLDVNYSYCNLILFDQTEEGYVYSSKQNRFFCNLDILPHYNLDGSQVSWRKKCFVDGCKFPEYFHVYWDAEWFEVLYEKYGKCKYNNTIGQYKKFPHKSFYARKVWKID